MFVYSIRNEKLFIFGPVVAAFYQPDLFVAEWLAMCGRSVLLVRRAIADMTIQHNECGSALRLLEDGEGLFDSLVVVGVAAPQHVPPVSEEGSRYILSESKTGVPLDRDV